MTSLNGHKSFVLCLAVHPDTKMILSGGFDGNVRLFHSTTRSCTLNVEAHAAAVVSVDYSPKDEHDFVSGSFDGLTRVWDSTYLSGCRKSFHCDSCPPV